MGISQYPIKKEEGAHCDCIHLTQEEENEHEES